MVDRNNLNRIKGILSAKQGAEVPKFTPGGPMLWNGQGNKEIKFHKKNGYASIYSNDGTTWFQDIGLAIPFTGSLDGYVDASELEVKPPLAIPGEQKLTPTTAVENAAATNAAVESAKKEQIAQTTAARNMEALPVVSSNILHENKVIYNGPSPEEQFKQEVSAGMKLKAEQQAVQNVAELKKAQTWGNVGQVATDAITSVGNAFGAKQAATDSDTTKTVDAVYNGAADAISNFGPWGKAIGGAMKIAGAAGNIIQEMGGGTDQQTTVDKWMDSAFFSWNIGMLNGFAGKNTDSFGADMDTLAAVGSSYGGTASDISDAADKAGKKYGLFSTKARKKANEAIAKAKSQQNLMGSIADNATDQRLAVQSMGEQAGLAYSMMTSGGYDQKYTYAAKQGGTLEWEPNIVLEWEPSLEWEPQVELNWDLPTFKDGGNVELIEELEWIPEFKSGNKIRTIEELIEYAKKKNPRFIQRLSEEPRGIKFTDDEGKDAEGSHYLESRGEYVIPRIQEINGELKFLSPQEAIDRAMESGNYLEMSPEEAIIFAEQYKQGWPEFFKKFKKGGSVGDSDVPEIEETVQKNVIPEGALHKNKHHMEHAEGLTKKGIPVIDEEGEQQAEIEHSEIIFTLEVTKKLEEYYEIFYSDESSNKEKEQAALEAGRLLVYQILENTEDRTGLIDSCKKGGTITLKTTTDDLIEEVLEWMPTVVIVEEKEPEEKPKKKEEKSDKELMKEAIKEVLIELLTK